MSDLLINVSYSGDDAPPRQREEPVSQFRKKKRLRKKLRQLQSKGLRHGGKQTHHNNHHSAMSGQSRKGHHQQAPRQNGELFTTPSTHKDRSLPHSSSTESNSEPSTSATHSLPSLTVTVVNNKHGGTSPKDSVDNATASSSSSSSPTVVSLADNRRQFKVSHGHKPTALQTSLGNPAKYVAMDCEMVGTGPKGSISQLARCSVVSYDGDVIYDNFINPSAPVTDYRTRWSGIRRCDLVNAKPYAEARKEILRLFMGKVVIGHAIHNDFKVLNYCHPAPLTRDTSRIPLLNTRAGFAETEVASLKRLTKRIFNRDIQKGRKGHSSVEDARATMELYKVVEEEWERTLANTRK